MYIITQADGKKISNINEIDVLVDTETEQICTFETMVEALDYLSESGVYVESLQNLPFNIKIERLQ